MMYSSKLVNSMLNDDERSAHHIHFRTCQEVHLLDIIRLISGLVKESIANAMPTVC